MLTVTKSEKVTREQYLERKHLEGDVEARLLIFVGDDGDHSEPLRVSPSASGMGV